MNPFLILECIIILKTDSFFHVFKCELTKDTFLLCIEMNLIIENFTFYLIT